MDQCLQPSHTSSSGLSMGALESFNSSQIGAISGGVFINSYGSVSYAAAKPGDNIDDVVQWLSPINFPEIQSSTFSKHTPGTGAWLLEHENFKAWITGETKVLWLMGMRESFNERFPLNESPIGTLIAGAGKSVLASMVNDYVKKLYRQSPRKAFLVAYCRYDAKYTALDILSALAKQLVASAADPVVIKEFTNFYAAHKVHKTRPTIFELVELFDNVSPHYEIITFSIDALDELGDEAKEGLLDALAQLKANIWITSRPSAQMYRDMLEDVCTIRLEIAAVASGDIQLHIRKKMATIPRLRALINKDQATLDRLVQKLTEKSAGMFLLTSLQMEHLRHSTSLGMLEASVETLPSDLASMYRTTWDRIKSQSPEDFDLARRVFLWITHSLGGVSPTLLTQALAVDVTREIYDDSSRPPLSVLEAVCGGLLMVDGSERGGYDYRKVRLAHYTAADFFELPDILEQLSKDPHRDIALTCVIRLQYAGYPDDLLDQEKYTKWHEDSISEHGFSQYALLWPHHARFKNLTGEGMSPYDRLSDIVSKWKRIPHEHSSWYSALPIPSDRNSIKDHRFDTIGLPHLAAHYQLTEFKDAILNSCLTARTSRGWLPVHSLLEGAYLGSVTQEAAIELLKDMLSCGMDVNSINGGGWTPLMLAAFHLLAPVVDFLLSVPGIDTRICDPHGRSAFHLAAGAYLTADRSSTPVLRLLLPHADVNARDADGMTAALLVIHSSSFIDKADLTWLLEHPLVDLNIQENHGQNTLHVLLNNWFHNGGSHMEELSVMLAREDLDINHRDVTGRTPFDYWFQSAIPKFGDQELEALKLLLAHPRIEVGKLNLTSGVHPEAAKLIRAHATWIAVDSSL